MTHSIGPVEHQRVPRSQRMGPNDPVISDPAVERRERRRAGRVKGAATGAAKGAATGSPAGVLAGAAKGATKRSRARTQRRTAGRASRRVVRAATAGGTLPRSGARRVLVAEWIVCSLIVGVSPVTSKHRDEPPAAFLKRISGVAFLFLILGIASAGGRGAAKVSAAMGGLVTVVLLIQDREVFRLIADRFTSEPESGPAGPEVGDSEGGGGGEHVGADSAGTATVVPEAGATSGAGGISRPGPGQPRPAVL